MNTILLLEGHRRDLYLLSAFQVDNTIFDFSLQLHQFDEVFHLQKLRNMPNIMQNQRLVTQ